MPYKTLTSNYIRYAIWNGKNVNKGNFDLNEFNFNMIKFSFLVWRVLPFYTGHTQNIGVVSIVIPIETAPFFVYALYFITYRVTY
jgi:hypothetical protein